MSEKDDLSHVSIALATHGGMCRCTLPGDDAASSPRPRGRGPETGTPGTETTLCTVAASVVGTGTTGSSGRRSAGTATAQTPGQIPGGPEKGANGGGGVQRERSRLSGQHVWRLLWPVAQG